MEFLVPLINHISYCASLVFLFSIKIQGSKWRYLLFFTILLLADIVLRFIAPYQASFLLIAVSTLIYGENWNGKKKTLYVSVTATFIIWIITAICSGLVMLLAPNFHGGMAFNFLMAGLLPIISLLLAKYKALTGKLFLVDDGAAYAVSVQSLIMAFFNFVLPCYPIVNKQLFGVICLSFTAFQFVTTAILLRMGSLIRKNREAELLNRQAEEYCKAVQEKYITVIRLRHYYTKLFMTLQSYIQKDDMQELKRYFEEHISAVYIKEIGNRRQLAQIHDELLRNLVEVTLGEIAQTMEQIAFDFQVSGMVEIPEGYSSLFFEITNILIDNAMNNLRGQETGLFQLVVSAQPESLSIKITNTLMQDINIKDLFDTAPNYGHGYGLGRIREIVGSDPCIEHYAYKAGYYEDKLLLTQQICLFWENGA